MSLVVLAVQELLVLLVLLLVVLGALLLHTGPRATLLQLNALLVALVMELPVVMLRGRVAVVGWWPCIVVLVVVLV